MSSQLQKSLLRLNRQGIRGYYHMDRFAFRLSSVITASYKAEPFEFESYNVSDLGVRLSIEIFSPDSIS